MSIWVRADFGEPAPEAVGPLKRVLGEVEMHKLVMLGPEIDALRPEAEALFRGRATLTTAVSGMLEVSARGRKTKRFHGCLKTEKRGCRYCHWARPRGRRWSGF